MELPMSYKYLKFLSIFILLFFLAGHSYAQAGDSAGASASLDTAQLIEDESPGDTTVSTMVIEGSADSIKIWKRNPRFAYMSYLDSLLKKRKGVMKVDTFSFAKKTEKSASNTAMQETSSPGILNSGPVKIFFWVVAIFFIFFILYRLVFKGGLFSGGSIKREDEPPPAAHEELDDYNAYNDLIKNAEEKNDFNLATRYLYLQSLKRLNDHELILFSPDKTNNMYVHELSGNIFQSTFAHLTLNYEYIWYGKFSVSRDRYIQLKNSFYSFNQKI